MARLPRRWALLLLLTLGACVGPSGWDARTDGGRRPPDPHDTRTSGQSGVEDHRSGSQNAFHIDFGC